MKYVKPTAKIEMVETTDILATSSENAEIVFSGEGKGDVIFDAFDLFGTK